MDNIVFHSDRFEILIDVRGFRPEDISCKISPNMVEVFAQRQETADVVGRIISLSRNYQLPQNVRPENGDCYLSSEGVLLVTAPWQ
ncbi:unnamed protein product [Acanthoscelides obtectus]|uniref:SHSP domain-containing protein n=1 Tax=Acanthoscelides obtectus TaxID=200917 RepID=A0A9P0K508_ACAOB